MPGYQDSPQTGNTTTRALPHNLLEKPSEPTTGQQFRAPQLLAVLNHKGSIPAPAINKKLTKSNPSVTESSLIQMQRNFGNRHVQRVISLAEQHDHSEVGPEIEEAIEYKKGGGQPLESGVRQPLESTFQTDFSKVRVHQDIQADTLNRALNARAFTIGQDLFFSQGTYNPGTSQGRGLLAHELTHVVQQTGDGIRPKLTVSEPGDVLEREADEMAKSVVQAEQQSQRIGESNLQHPAETLDSPKQASLQNLQRAHGHLAISRSFGTRDAAGIIQRDGPPAASGTAAPVIPKYDPPAMVTAGTLPDNARIDSLGAIPNLPGDILGVLPSAFSDASFATAATIRTALNRETLRNNFNGYQGAGVSIPLQQVSDRVADFDGYMTIQAKIKNVRFLRADGIQISDTATSGVSATGSGSTATATGVSGEANVSAGDPKEGGQVGAKMGVSSTTTRTSGVGTGTAGAGARSVSPNASAVFLFDVEWQIAVTYQRSPRTWNAIVSLGISSIYSAVAEDNVKRNITRDSVGGQLRIPVVDCTERLE